MVARRAVELQLRFVERLLVVAENYMVEQVLEGSKVQTVKKLHLLD